MEHIYYDIPKSELHKLNEEIEELQQILSDEVFPKNDDELRIEMGFKDADIDFEELKKETDISKIYNYDDVRVSEFIPGDTNSNHLPLYNMPSPGNKLKTFKKFEKLRKEKNPLFLKSELNERFICFKQLLEFDEARDLTPIKEARFTIRCYKPFHYSKKTSRQIAHFEEEIQCLSSQFLSEFRDKIFCETNTFSCPEISDNPNEENPTRELDPGTLFITDTFYNDTRNKLNPDYSENILEWMKTESDFVVSKYKKAKMETTRFADLNFRLGFPQVYMHNGDCEHIFIFSQVELISTPSDQERILYPLLRSICRDIVKVCDSCGRRQREFMVVDSVRNVDNYSLECKQCVLSYNYIDNKKVGEFKLYRINPNAITPIDANNTKIVYPELTQENARYFINPRFKHNETAEEDIIDEHSENLDVDNIEVIAKQKKPKEIPKEHSKARSKLKRKPVFNDLSDTEKKDILLFANENEVTEKYHAEMNDSEFEDNDCDEVFIEDDYNQDKDNEENIDDVNNIEDLGQFEDIENFSNDVNDTDSKSNQNDQKSTNVSETSPNICSIDELLSDILEEFA